MTTPREDIAAAASSLADVTVDAWPSQQTQPGFGFVSLGQMGRDTSGLGYMDRWFVTIVVPQDLQLAETWIETHRDQLVAALEPVMVVLNLRPIQLVLDQGTVNAVSVEGARGH